MPTKLTHFKTGAVRDAQEGKEDYPETIPWLALQEFARYMTPKQKKYGRGNYKKGFPLESAEMSACRHTQKYFAIQECINRGLEPSPELEPWEDHAAACVFNWLVVLYERRIEKIKKNNKKHLTINKKRVH